MNNRIVQAYGPHLVLDGYKCDPNKLLSLGHVYDYLYEMPDKIDMTRVMPPYAFKFYAQDPSESGISGFVIIAESHISLHTYPEKAYISLDIFSCKDFDVLRAVEETTKHFGIGKIEYQVLTRGLEFPRCIPTVANHVAQERVQVQGKL